MNRKEIFFQVAKEVRQRSRRMITWPKLTARCAICSYRIFKRLKEAGFKPKFVANYYHAFVLCDGFLIDVTASQFDEPDIIVQYGKPKRRRYWKVEDTATNDRGIKKLLKAWTSDQVPVELRRKRVSCL